MSQTKRRLPWLPLTLGVSGALVAGALVVNSFWINQSANDFLEHGRQALQSRDFAVAQAYVERALERAPESPQARLLAGQVAMSMNRFPAALEHFDKVPDNLAGVSADARCAAGDLLLLHFKRLSQAERQYRLALRHDPNMTQAHDHLAFALGLGGRNWELVPHRLALIKADHVEPLHLYLLSLGEVAIENDDLVAEYHRACPDDPAPLVALSRLAFEDQDYARAKSLAQSAIKLDPQLVEAHVKLGRALLEMEDDASLETWRRGLPRQADSHPGIWTIRGAWAKRSKRSRAAIRCYWEAVRRDANHQEANYQLGRQLQLLGRSTEAQPFLDRARLLQQYVNVVKLATHGDPRRGLHPAADLAERLGLVWEAFAWHRLVMQMDPYSTVSEVKCGEFRVMLARLKPPFTRNLADANPALEIDLSDFPLPPAPSHDSPSTPEKQLADAVTPRFENQAALAGIHFQYFNGGDPSDIRKMYEFTGGGVGVVDYDGDHWPDLYLTQGAEWPVDLGRASHLDRMYRNLGDGRFEDVTEKTQIVEAGFSQGAAVGDIDNDGFPDIYVANIGANRLFHNNGDGTFSESPLPSDESDHRWTSSCFIADVNNDTFPDIYAVNYLTGKDVFTLECGDRGVCMPQHFPAAQDWLYLSQGDGSFQDITETSGIQREDGKGLGVVAADFDEDSKLDLFIANDSVPNFLFRRKTKDAIPPVFADVGMANGLAMNEAGRAEACMGVASADVNGDSRLDLYVTNFYQESNTLYLQAEGGVFWDSTRLADLRDPSMYMLGFGVQFLDAELDGRPDLFVANGHIDDFRTEGQPFQMPPQWYRNLGNGKFDVFKGGETGDYFDGVYLGRSVARLDYNRDGREDLAVSHLDAPLALLANATSSHGGYLAVRLSATRSARDAIGASVRVSAAGRKLVAHLTAGDGYQASNERRLVFGLGDAKQVESLQIRWPSGQVQRFQDIEPDRELFIVEGRDDALRQSTP